MTNECKRLAGKNNLKKGQNPNKRINKFNDCAFESEQSLNVDDDSG
jgi:hypothetical protein